MSEQSWVGGDLVAPFGRALQSNYTTAVAITPAGSAYPVNPLFWRKGKSFRATLNGAMSNIVTTPGTFTLSFQVGSIAAVSSGAINLSTTSNVLVPFRAVCEARCDVVATGAFQLLGMWSVESLCVCRGASAANDGAGNGWFMSVPVLGTAFDGGIAGSLDCFGGFSIAQTTNGIRIDQYSLEFLN